MFVKIIYQDNFEKIIKIPDHEQLVVTYSNSIVYEFCIKILHDINDTTFILEDLEKELRILPYENIKEVQLLENDKNTIRFSHTGAVKGIFYRTFYYCSAHIPKNEENISIRFQEKNKVIYDFDNLTIYCDPSCPYLENHICKNYSSKKLATTLDDKHIVLLECYLENDGVFRNSEKFERYNLIYNMTDHLGHIPYTTILN